jgi:hypothetical protein
MKRFPDLKRLKDYFLEVPLPDAVFQLTTSHLTGLRISPRERSANGHFICRLPAGAVRPSFDKTNFADVPLLESKVREGMAKMGLGQGTVAILLPELCARVFILNLDSTPVSQKEKEKIIRWRVGKQMPVVPDDARFVSQGFPAGSSERIVVAVGRGAVLQEYEDLFSRCQLAAGNLSLPSLSLINLLPAACGDVLVVNVEEDSLSFAAVIDSELSLFRQKAFAFDRTPGAPHVNRIGGLLKEVENTMHFLEDKEKKRVRSLWFRSGLPEAGVDIAAELRRLLALTVRETGELAVRGEGNGERGLLSPLFGQLA